jgi:peptide/nickel transport system substrate-binding protein
MKPRHAFLAAALLLVLPGSLNAGGQVVVQVAQPLETLHPLLQPQHPAMPLVFTGMLSVDTQEKLIPELASVVPTPEAGMLVTSGADRLVTYRLRSSLRWHDGRPVTAADAVFTAQLERRLATNPPSPIVEAKALDRERVQVRLRGNTSLASVLKFLVPRHPFRSVDEALDPQHPFWRHPAGSGPFAVVEWLPGKRLRVDANPQYYRGRPTLDQIVVQFGRPMLPSAVRNVQVWTDIPFSWWPKLNPPAATDPAWRLAVTRLPVWEGLRFNLQGPLNERPLRQALMRAIDRERLAKAVFGENAILAKGVRPAGVPVVYAPTEARKLWGREAAALTLIHPAGGVHAATAAELVQQWGGIGVTVRAESVPVRDYQDRLAAGSFDISLSERLTDRDDGVTAYHSKYRSPVGNNESALADGKLDQLLLAESQGGTEAVQQARKAAVDSRLTELAPGAALYYYPTWHAYKKDIVLDTSNPWGPLWRAYTWRKAAR